MLARGITWIVNNLLSLVAYAGSQPRHTMCENYGHCFGGFEPESNLPLCGDCKTVLTSIKDLRLARVRRIDSPKGEVVRTQVPYATRREVVQAEVNKYHMNLIEDAAGRKSGLRNWQLLNMQGR